MTKNTLFSCLSVFKSKVVKFYMNTNEGDLMAHHFFSSVKSTA